MEVIILLGVLMVPAYLLQTFFGFKQMQSFSREFKRMRGKGRVAIGRKSGYIGSGVIIFLLLDDQGFIQEGKKLQGTSVIARFKNFSNFVGDHITDIPNKLSKIEKEIGNVKKASLDAYTNYQLVSEGKEIPVKKSMFGKIKSIF